MKFFYNLGAYLQLFYSATETSMNIEILQGASFNSTFIQSDLCKMSTKIDLLKILMTNGSLMKVKSIQNALEHSAILLTCTKR